MELRGKGRSPGKNLGESWAKRLMGLVPSKHGPNHIIEPVKMYSSRGSDHLASKLLSIPDSVLCSHG